MFPGCINFITAHSNFSLSRAMTLSTNNASLSVTVFSMIAGLFASISFNGSVGTRGRTNTTSVSKYIPPVTYSILIRNKLVSFEYQFSSSLYCVDIRDIHFFASARSTIESDTSIARCNKSAASYGLISI